MANQMFISYAQNFEDVMLWRALKHVENGFYIDIGSQDPIVDSVSLAFYEQGWRGIHIEPNSHYAKKMRAARPDEHVVQVAIGCKEDTIKFFEFEGTGLSTGNPEIAAKHQADGFSVKETEVHCSRLAKILDDCKDRDIHWLKIDVEGMEEEVLQSWLPSDVRPWIVVVESTLPRTQNEMHDQWDQLLIEIGYDFTYFDGLNRFYVYNTYSKLKEAFNCGPNIFDGFVLSGTASVDFCYLLNHRIDVQSAGNQALMQQKDELFQQNQALMQERDELAQENENLLGQKDLLARELKMIYSSKSWRIIAKFREWKKWI